MPQIGATIEEMQSLQSKFTQESATVEQLKASITGQLGATWWVGPARQRFEDAWNSQYQPMLTQLQTSLQECSAEVQRTADGLVAAGG